MNCKDCNQEMNEVVDIEDRSIIYYCNNYDCSNGPNWVTLQKAQAIKYAHDLAHLLLRFNPGEDDKYGIELKNRVKKLLDVLTIGREIRK